MRVRVSPFAPRKSTANLARNHQACKRHWRHSASSSAGSTSPCRSSRSRARCRSAWRGWRRPPRSPGFRPGKVPLKMVAQQYGPQVRSDVITDTVQTSLNDAIREQNLRVAGYPRIEPKEAANNGSVRVLRRSSRSIPRSSSATCRGVTHRAAGGRASSLRRRRPHARDPAQAERPLRDRRAAGAGGRPRAGRFHRHASTASSFPGGQAKDFAIVLGEGRMLPEFEAALTGMTAGETKSIRASPSRADYHGKEVAGKDRAVHAHGASRSPSRRLPDVDAEFAEGLRHRQRQRRRAARRSEGQSRHSSCKRKIDAVRQGAGDEGAASPSQLVAIPKSLVETRGAESAARAASDLKSRGMQGRGHRLVAGDASPAGRGARGARPHPQRAGAQPAAAGAPRAGAALVTEAAQSYEQPDAVVRWHYETARTARRVRARGSRTQRRRLGAAARAGRRPSRPAFRH